MQNLQVPSCSGDSAPWHALFRSGGTTLNGCASSRLGKQPFCIAQEKLPSTHQTSIVVSCSDLDGDETLGVMLARGLACQLSRSTKFLNCKPQFVNAKEAIIQGGPKAKKSNGERASQSQ